MEEVAVCVAAPDETVPDVAADMAEAVVHTAAVASSVCIFIWLDTFSVTYSFLGHIL